MARFGLLDRMDTHGASQRIVTTTKPYGEAVGLGKRIPAGVSGAEILLATETDYTIELVAPNVNGKVVPGMLVPCKRTADGGLDPFGAGRAVGKGFTLMQNSDLIGFGEAVIESSGRRFEWEAGGYLGNGSIVWYQARMSEGLLIRETELGQDKEFPFLFLINAHNGVMSTTGCFTMNRPFCNNQIASILEGGVNKVRVTHTKHSGQRLIEAARVLREALTFYDRHAEEMRRLDAVAMNQTEMRSFAEKLIAETRDAIDGASESIKASQAARDLAKADRLVELFGNGLGNVGRSRYDALQAVAELEDHHKPVRSADSRFRRLLLAPPEQDVKARALRLLLK